MHNFSLTWCLSFCPDISSNDLTGPIPTEISQLELLTTFVAGENSLTGQIPLEFAALDRLFVSLSTNQI